MAASGRVDGCSDPNSKSDQSASPVTLRGSLGIDSKKNMFTWHGSVEDLQNFCVEELNLEQPKITRCERSTSFKTKCITFTLYTSTKTLQIQGTNQKEIKTKLKSLIELSNGSELGQQDFKDAEDESESEIELDPNNGERDKASNYANESNLKDEYQSIQTKRLLEKVLNDLNILKDSHTALMTSNNDLRNELISLRQEVSSIRQLVQSETLADSQEWIGVKNKKCGPLKLENRYELLHSNESPPSPNHSLDKQPAMVMVDPGHKLPFSQIHSSSNKQPEIPSQSLDNQLRAYKEKQREKYQRESKHHSEKHHRNGKKVLIVGDSIIKNISPSITRK